MFKYIELPATDNDIMPWIAYAFRMVLTIPWKSKNSSASDAILLIGNTKQIVYK